MNRRQLTYLKLLKVTNLPALTLSVMFFRVYSVSLQFWSIWNAFSEISFHTWTLSLVFSKIFRFRRNIKICYDPQLSKVWIVDYRRVQNEYSIILCWLMGHLSSILVLATRQLTPLWSFWFFAYTRLSTQCWDKKDMLFCLLFCSGWSTYINDDDEWSTMFPFVVSQATM